jgi:hypothetical protein
MDSVFEQFDLMCSEPDGCDVLVQVLRAIVWSYFGIALVIFFVAARAWTRDLPDALGVGVAAVASLVIVLIGRSLVASTGSVRLLIALTAFGLLAAWVGRPDVTRRQRRSGDDDVNGDASPTSARH